MTYYLRIQQRHPRSASDGLARFPLWLPLVLQRWPWLCLYLCPSLCPAHENTRLNRLTVVCFPNENTRLNRLTVVCFPNKNTRLNRLTVVCFPNENTRLNRLTVVCFPNENISFFFKQIHRCMHPFALYMKTSVFKQTYFSMLS